MTILKLKRLDQDANRYQTIASWNPDQEDTPPDPFLKIYPQEVWHKQSTQYFLDRIDGPYTILTQRDQEE